MTLNEHLILKGYDKEKFMVSTVGKHSNMAIETTLEQLKKSSFAKLLNEDVYQVGLFYDKEFEIIDNFVIEMQ